MEKKITTKEDIYEAMQYTAQLAREKGFSYGDMMKLQLVTEEACTNSYEYCQSEKIPFFTIKWAITEKSAEMMIKQKGGIFPLRKKNTTTSLRGRGITLILSLMDEVEVREEEEDVVLYLKKVKGE